MVQLELLPMLLTIVVIRGRLALFKYTILALFGSQSALHRVARPDLADKK